MFESCTFSSKRKRGTITVTVKPSSMIQNLRMRFQFHVINLSPAPSESIRKNSRSFILHVFVRRIGKGKEETSFK